MSTVYILYSPSLKKYYVGSTRNLDQRLVYHNAGKSTYTSKGRPWKVIHVISCPDHTSAIQLEMKIKKRGIRRFLDENSISTQ